MQVIARILVHSSKRAALGQDLRRDLPQVEAASQILRGEGLDVSAFTRARPYRAGPPLPAQGHPDQVLELHHRDRHRQLEDRLPCQEVHDALCCPRAPVQPGLPARSGRPPCRSTSRSWGVERSRAAGDEGRGGLGRRKRAEDPEVSSLRAWSHLDAAVKFCRHLTSSLDVVAQLLASSSITDHHGSHLLHHAPVPVHDPGQRPWLRRGLPLIFPQQTVGTPSSTGSPSSTSEMVARTSPRSCPSSPCPSTSASRFTQEIFKELWQKKMWTSLVDDLLALLPANAADAFTLRGAPAAAGGRPGPELVVESQIVQAGFRAARKGTYVCRAAAGAHQPRGYTLKADSAVFGKMADRLPGGATTSTRCSGRRGGLHLSSVQARR